MNVELERKWTGAVQIIWSSSDHGIGICSGNEGSQPHPLNVAYTSRWSRAKRHGK